MKELQFGFELIANLATSLQSGVVTMSIKTLEVVKTRSGSTCPCLSMEIVMMPRSRSHREVLY